LPATVIEDPGVPLPGAKVPPLAIAVSPTEPVPVSTPPAPIIGSLSEPFPRPASHW